MSTTTFMETFDTQMFESGDGDIPMYTGSRPAESWFSVEATMADEDSNTSIQPYHTEQSVEIEMADHDDEIIEYEMADEREYARDNDTEVADVDLVDVSRQTSPPPGVSVLSIPHIHSDAVPSYERAPSLASFGPSVDSARPDEAIEHFVVPQATDDVASATVTQVDSNPSDERAVPAVEDSQQVADSATTQLAPMNDAGVRLLGENTTTETADREAEAASDLVNGGETSRYEAASEQTNATEDKDGSSNPQLVDRLSSPNVPSSLPTAQGEILTEVPHEVEVLHLDRQDDAAPEPETLVVENGGLGTDPHEISEGVYIDPPPAVLLTITSPSQPLKCCLFNQPVRSPGSQSPSTSSAVEHALLLLLHHRPTLYYEPLSVVFDALRQEEHIQNVYDLERDELVLDAYDLQLVISEDNVHVHEVTLHDLNVLHDGADLTGPLRLELRVIPRFIARYNALREQIARLDLAVEEDQSYEDEPVYEHHGEEEHVSTNEAHGFEGQNDLNEGEQGQEQEGEEYVQENTGEQEATSHEQEDYGETQPDDAPAPKTAQEDSGQHKQGVQEPQQDEYDGTQDEAQDQDSPYESGDVQEYVDESVPNAGGDVLDADEVHRLADADEGGDYVDEKDVAPEDDEQIRCRPRALTCSRPPPS
ncbi:hypothetical protein DAEQUDRAFT_293461 [Daedalea quercina L-15889]|uniref:Uncharacterized protein n=1 Tax=Daedalea quercina L-15889 TaxID=1314783 RepID=A0A165TZV2_9APHY|nr:hypothetical protein DAEQUDRAFT_293461 [Daedalea quercina L-15889]